MDQPGFEDLRLDKESSTPLSTQLFDQLSNRITTGRLPPGRRLPSSNRLAKQLGVSADTVNRAYWKLERAELTDGDRGKSGGRVAEKRDPRPPPALPADSTPGIVLRLTHSVCVPNTDKGFDAAKDVRAMFVPHSGMFIYPGFGLDYDVVQTVAWAPGDPFVEVELARRMADTADLEELEACYAEHGWKVFSWGKRG
jgi:hypothetical protein